MRVLVVEDHPRLATTIAGVLRREGMAADVAFDGRDALDHAAAGVYDVIVLDRNLPRLHGDDVLPGTGRWRLPEPDPDADRLWHGRRPGGRPGPGRG